MENADDLRLVLVTVTPQAGGSEEDSEGRRIANALVEEGLAACVNRVPLVQSVYKWQGQVCQDGEELLLIKTTADRLQALEARVRELHSYDVPEVMAVPFSSGSRDYLEWARGMVAS